MTLADSLFPDPAMRRDPVFLAAVYCAAYSVRHDHDLKAKANGIPTSAMSYQMVDGQEVDHAPIPQGANATDALVARFRALPYTGDDLRGVMDGVLVLTGEALSDLGYQVEIGRVQ